MWKVMRKGLRANLVRFSLTAVAVIIGVSFMSGVMVLTATVQSVFDDLFANIYKGTDAVVRTHEVLSADFGQGEHPAVPASLLDAVRQAPGVSGAAGSVAVNYAQIIDKNGKAVGKPGQGPPTLGFAWISEPRLNQFHLLRGGRAPETGNEVVVDKHSADKAKLQVGDSVTILTSKRKTYHLVGIARFGTADSLAGASASLFTLSEAQRLANTPNQFASISVVAQPGVSQTTLQQNIDQYLQSRGQGTYEVLTGAQITKENQNAIHKQLGFISVALTIFALIALIVGSFIIYNTFSIVVAQRTRELALLRALGASQRQVLTEVVSEAVFVGLLASASGVAIGLGVAVGLKAVMGVLGFDLPSSGLTVRPSVVVVGLAVGSVVTVLSAIVPARQAARVPPIAAMRDVALERPPRRVLRLSLGGGTMGLGIVVLLGALFGKPANEINYVGLGAALVFVGAFVLGPLFARGASLLIGLPLTKLKGITGTLARENAARNPKRTATTATALLIGVALVGFITVFAASGKASISAAIDSSIKSDYIVQTGGFGPGSGLSPDIEAGIRALSQVQTVSGVRVGAAGIQGSRVFLFAVDPAAAATLVDLGSVSGSFNDLGSNDLAISKKVADAKHLSVGSTVNVTFVKRGARPLPLRVVYVYRQNNFGDYYISLPTYEQNYNEQLDFLILAKLKPGVSAQAGRAAIAPLIAANPTAKLQDNAQYKADQEQQVNQVVALIYTLLFFALIVALVGIANTLALSIHERTRELGLLRAVGMTRSQVRSTVRWESVIISLLGTINGLAIGLFFGWSVVTALHSEGFSKFAIAPGLLFIVVIILAVASVGAAFFPARRASKLDVLRAISTE